MRYKTKKILLIASAVLMMQQAYALDDPTRSRYDARIQKTAYNEEDVVLIRSANGYTTEIVFDKDEEVIKYGSGYSDAWEFVHQANHFYLKPKAPDANTNMFITTNKRSYAFDLRLVADKNQATYRVKFTYPSDEAAQKRMVDETAVIEERLKTGLVNPDSSGSGLLSVVLGANYNYSMSLGSKSTEIAPIEAYDNQHFTVLRFKTNADFPSVYRKTEKDGEVIVNSHVENGALVIHGVYKELILRAGRSVVGVYNESYTGGGTPVENGVSVNGVERVIKN